MSWSIDALYEHFTKVTDLILERMTELSTNIDRSVDLARQTVAAERAHLAELMNTRLEELQGFRGAMEDQASHFITRKELWGYMLAAVGFISLIVTLTIMFVK